MLPVVVTGNVHDVVYKTADGTHVVNQHGRDTLKYSYHGQITGKYPDIDFAVVGPQKEIYAVCPTQPYYEGKDVGGIIHLIGVGRCDTV